MKTIFSKEAKKVLDTIENTSLNVFVTGKAGTGKSTLLQHLRMHAHDKIIVLAPTGIAAVNVNGDTIHSFFTLKPGFEKAEATKMNLDQKKKVKFKQIKTIAIDEISMVRADLLDAIDIVLRRTRGNDKPFGGVQMVFFGDLYQLPPVVTPNDQEKFFSEYEAPYFFEADVFNGQRTLFSSGFKLKIIELKKIYRQKDKKFIEILNSVRDNTISPEQLDSLNERFDMNFTPPKGKKYIHLMTTNRGASYINTAYLEKLNAEEVSFPAEIVGDIKRNLYPNDENIVLRVGAQVMFISNDSERRWVNGTLGKVIDVVEEIDEKSGESELIVIVEKEGGEIVEVKKHLWEISRYVFNKGEFERENLGSFYQMPMKLAWAITIHKSQGKTFENVIIDLERGSFAHGQTYVALSRCTSLSGLVLKKKLYKSNIIMDPRVNDFK